MRNKALEKADEDLRREGKPGLLREDEIRRRLQERPRPEKKNDGVDQKELEKMLFGGK